MHHPGLPGGSLITWYPHRDKACSKPKSCSLGWLVTAMTLWQCPDKFTLGWANRWSVFVSDHYRKLMAQVGFIVLHGLTCPADSKLATLAKWYNKHLVSSKFRESDKIKKFLRYLIGMRASLCLMVIAVSIRGHTGLIAPLASCRIPVHLSDRSDRLEFGALPLFCLDTTALQATAKSAEK